MHVHRAIQRHKGKAQSLLPVSSEGKKKQDKEISVVHYQYQNC